VSTVRADFEGVVWYVVENGSPQSLKAGDEIPEGLSLGDHVVAAEVDDEAPADNASLEAWQEYAKSQGASDDDLDGMSRNELREQYGN
jgi:hypothetical protein